MSMSALRSKCHKSARFVTKMSDGESLSSNFRLSPLDDLGPGHQVACHLYDRAG